MLEVRYNKNTYFKLQSEETLAYDGTIHLEDDITKFAVHLLH